MEKSFDSSKGVYKSKVPEIQQTLDMVNILIKKRDDGEEMIVNYALCDTVFARAKLQPAVGKVNLWIGASTMVYLIRIRPFIYVYLLNLLFQVEYSYEEAIELLTMQLEQCQAKIEELNEDLYHLRGNSITVEVNMARLFNYSVKMKKLASMPTSQAPVDIPMSPELKPK